jgi:hypothetical protein
MEKVEHDNAADNRTPHAPNWRKWRSCVQARVYEAVALACDLDPESPSIVWHAKHRIAQLDGPVDAMELWRSPPPMAVYQNPIPDSELENYLERLDVACNHAQGKTLLTSYGETDGSVSLPAFASWAEKLGWTLPEEFPRPSPAVTATGAPIGTKERTTLLAIIGALAEMAKIDITNPTKAANAIVRQFEEQGRRIGQRTVEEHLKRVRDAQEAKEY